jgi:hypothetical protein
MLSAMTTPTSFERLIAAALSLVAMINTRDDLHLRPEFARQAIAARMKTGLIVLKTFVRRLIILIALELEWSLVEARGEMKRPHKTKSLASHQFHLPTLDCSRVSPWIKEVPPNFKPRVKSKREDGTNPAVYVGMARLYAHLEFLAKIAENPFPKAKRLAFHLARRQPGLILTLEGPKRIAGRWGTEIRTYYDWLPTLIIEKSRTRPPPLPPPRPARWPMTTTL